MRTRQPLLSLLMTAALAFPAPFFTAQAQAVTATIQTTLNYARTLPAGIVSLKLENLAGHLTVTQGTRFQVTATVVAGGKDEATGQALARSVRFDTSQSGNGFTLHVDYPVNQYTSFNYPDNDNNSAGNGSHCFIGVFCVNDGGNNLSYQGKAINIYRNGNRGTPLHVDLVVQVPAGLALTLVNYAGLTEVNGIKNDLQVKTSSGDVHVSDVHGQFSADTGSGDVHVAGLTGDFTADTGSGDVFAEHISGNVHADTGSGDVHVSEANSQILYADTGSGDVTFSNVKGDMKFDTGSGDVRLDDANGSLHADTGSGDVIARNYTGGESIWAGTGSGDVSLTGDLSAVRKLYIDTGSGDASLKTTDGLSLHMDASSNSGDVNINLPHMHNMAMHRGKFIADFGKAEGSGTISTGSGDINVTHE
ncbi:MAG TPA: DUF4097 family beta strand repeat-containing protein [Gammaproteobacteria bacterium]|nr:DUF4097 family beta strand repeat-containing protein [Gammaproteobacteria bacterium]